MSAALARHDAVARAVIGDCHGELLKHTGDGVVAVFEDASDALRAAVLMQRELPDEVPVRAGMHVGPAEARDGDYFGPTLNRTARIMALARAGQVLVSGGVAVRVGDDLPAATSLVDVGEHPLKDFERPERLFQAVGEGLWAEPPTTAPNLGPLGVGRSSFVGREADVDELEARVAGERLLTLTGVGGSGKTRLAFEVARRVADGFADGVFVVELAPLADPADLARAVAGAVEMPVVASSVERDLAIFLRARRCLIVLDNCEHLLDACAELVNELLTDCPDVTFLATSREALAIEGERAWRVPSLSLPDDDDPLACDAATLFVARACSARGDFNPDDHVAAITEICRRLDGLPLAIELAAARVSHLTPEQITSMLDDRFRLLTGGKRRARQRQQTLQAAMDWSHELLGDDERRLFRRLSVFAGGCTLDAAVTVCAEAAEAVGTIDALGSLVDKSLVVADETDAEMRYRMLETVRLYGQDRLLAAGEADALRNRHSEWMLAWLDQVVDPSRPGNFSRSAARIETELDNLRAALDWARERQRPDLVVLLVSRSWSMWYQRLRSDEGRRWLEPAADLADAGLPLADRVAWRAALSALAQETMDGATMLRRSREATALDPDNTVPLTVEAWTCLVQVALFTDVDRANQLAETATEAVRSHDTPDGEATVKLFSALARCLRGDWQDSRSLLESIVDEPGVDVFTGNFASLALAASLHVLAEDDEALRRLTTLIDLMPFHPGRHVDTVAYAILAVVETSRGAADSGRSALAVAAERVRRRYAHIPGAWGVPVVAAGAMLAIQGRDAEAVQVLVGAGAGGRLWSVRAEPTYLLHRCYADRLAERMTAEDFTAAWRLGEQMTADDLIQIVDDLAGNR